MHTHYSAKPAVLDIHTPETILKELSFRVRKISFWSEQRAKTDRESCVYGFTQLDVDVVSVFRATEHIYFTG